MAQEAFGRHDDERLANAALHLASESVEVLSGGGEVADLPVAFGAELKEAFEACAGVLRALAFVAVWQEKHEVAGLHPFAFRAGDELVDNDLGTIDEVAELGFPADENVGCQERVAVIETENGGFGEEAVVNAEAALVRGEILEGDEAFASLGVVEDGVALGEGAATAILAGEPDAMAVGEEGSEGEGLGVCPVEAFTGFDGLATCGEESALDGGVEAEFGGGVEEFGADGAQGIDGDPGGDDIVAVAGLRNKEETFEGVATGFFLTFLKALDAVFEFLDEFLFEGRGLLRCEDVGSDELIPEQGGRGGMAGDGAGHVGLGECGLVCFVVAVAAVADDVDDDITGEGLPELESELGDPGDFEGAITIDMEDGDFEELGDVGAVVRGAGVGGKGGETDLVVDDDVDGSAGAIAGELGKVQHFGNDALAGEGGITVNEDGDDFFAFERVIKSALAGAGLAFDNRVDSFEVAGVGGEHDADAVARFGLANGFEAEVILHVAIASDHVGDVVLGEFVEENFEGFAEEVGEHAEAAAVGHAHDDFFAAENWQAFEDGAEGNEEAFTAFDGEAFLADVTAVEETLEGFGFKEPTEGADLFFGRGNWVFEAIFDAILKPLADFGSVDVHVLEADPVAVDGTEIFEHRTERHGLALAEELSLDGLIHVTLSETERGHAEDRWGGGGLAERVEPGSGVAERAESVECVGDAHPEVERFFREGLGEAGRGVFLGGQVGHAEFETLKERGPGGVHGFGV